MTYFGSLIFYEGIYGSILPLLHPKDNLHSISYMNKSNRTLSTVLKMTFKHKKSTDIVDALCGY